MVKVLAICLLALFSSVASQAQTSAPAAEQLLQAGSERLKAGDYDAAISKLQEAIAARGGRYAEAHLQLGLAYFEQEKIAEAGAAFERAAEQNPELPLTQRYLAEVALYEGDYDKAVAAYDLYLDLLPRSAEDRLPAVRRLARLRSMAMDTYDENAAETRLQLLSRPRPSYPEKLKEKIVGDVIVEALFTADSEISGARVLQSLGKEFDEEALRVITTVRFKPATKKGKPVSKRQRLKLHFQQVLGDTK